jgi:predicted RNA binding protein YcfA (HicA-like mRNA interferase family)
VSQRDKLIKRIRARPPEAEFDDVDLLLRSYGWAKARECGSHVTYTKTGELPIGLAKWKGTKVKRTYLEKICERLDLND